VNGPSRIDVSRDAPTTENKNLPLRGSIGSEPTDCRATRAANVGTRKIG